jgi:IS5 family transposase
METLLEWGSLAGSSRNRRGHTTGMKSKVHPTYQTQYRVANWPAYNRALVRRGDVTLWLAPEAVAAWTPRRSGARGGQRRYSDLAIQTALTLRLIYHLPLRQAEGFVNSLFAVMDLDLFSPNYTTLSRRGRHLGHDLRSPVPTGGGIHLILDSTGLSIVGEGEWAAAKYGGRGRRGWKTLHLGVDRSGGILAHTLTEATVDDATTALGLITAVDGHLASVTADAAYDTVAVYDTAAARGATVVVPPLKTANVSRRGLRSPARDRTITNVATLGRRRWKKESGYHRQARVENAFFRYKSIIGDSLRARSPAGQASEAVLGCQVLNRMTDLGRPASYSIAR